MGRVLVTEAVSTSPTCVPLVRRQEPVQEARASLLRFGTLDKGRDAVASQELSEGLFACRGEEMVAGRRRRVVFGFPERARHSDGYSLPSRR